MTDYEFWRSIAASWGSLYFGAIFLIAVVIALLPSRKRAYDEAARIPLKDD
jgi:cytochrome c oxidase cbb3-type subunit IV